MAYTPINWQTGDTITAEKMNKMDNGWGVQNTQLFSETVTIVTSEFGNEAPLTYALPITSSTLTVTLNGTSYTCPRIDAFGQFFYGGFDASTGMPDFTTIPFFILSGSDGSNSIITETEGTYTVSASGEGIAVSDNFNTAVNQCVDTSAMPMLCVSGTTTRLEIATAVTSGRLLYFYYTQDYNEKLCFIANMYTTPMALIPSDARVTASFDSDEDATFIVTVL